MPSDAHLRIGELAELAGTTTRAVRHYHAIGLLAEPARDESGYRRYGAEHLVRLVRIRRLRALDMPLERIAAHLAGTPGDLDASLRSLADDLGRQIEELQALRARVLALAASNALAAPAERWREALGVPALPAGEQEAVALLDALHPQGVEGLLAQSSALLAGPGLPGRVGPLLERFREVPDDEAAVEELAAGLAALLPRPERAAPPVDLETMEKLLGDRFTPPQRRVLRRLRELLAERER
jgi:DNA-binding transcriptional MerR regulator